MIGRRANRRPLRRRLLAVKRADAGRAHQPGACPARLVTGVVRIFVDQCSCREPGLADRLLGGLVAAAVLQAVLTWMRHYLARLEAKLAITSSSEFLWHVLRLPLVFFLQR